MKSIRPAILGLVILFTSCANNPATESRSSSAVINLDRAQAMEVGRKVWQNECGGTIDGLTAWNSGEDFASMGIGHFIWYPAGKQGRFKESFPELLRFLQSKGVSLPASLAAIPPCPWSTKSQFQAEFRSARSTEIRNFLANTIPQQTEFLVLRLERSLPQMLAATPANRRQQIEANFKQVASTPNGVYALIDYVNFKGEGTVASERYQGQGWGLLQVLDGMQPAASATDAFADSAQAVLAQRVANSPPGRNEKRWLKGWYLRVDSYR